MRRTIREINRELQHRWPKALGIPPVPLKLLVHLDLLAAGMARHDVARALHLWTRSRSYLSRLVEGAARIDLDGNPAGEITAAQAAHAAQRLAERRVKQEADRKQAALAPETVAEKACSTVEQSLSKPRRSTLAELRAAAQARRERRTA